MHRILVLGRTMRSRPDKREPGEIPGQTTLLCFPQPSCSTHTFYTIVTVEKMMGRRCYSGISQKTCPNALIFNKLTGLKELC